MMPPAAMWFFFGIGILSALAFRLVIVFHHVDPGMVRSVWYAGVVGYTFFFFYRYSISRKRKRAVKKYCLLDKVSRGDRLEGEDRQAAEYLLRSISRSREDINYLIIFILSVAAVAIDLLLKYGAV